MTTYWHASPARLSPGSTLLPPSKSGIEPNYAVGRPTTRVYLSARREEAQEWGMHLRHLSRLPKGTEIFLYQAQPVGRVVHQVPARHGDGRAPRRLGDRTDGPDPPQRLTVILVREHP